MATAAHTGLAVLVLLGGAGWAAEAERLSPSGAAGSKVFEKLSGQEAVQAFERLENLSKQASETLDGKPTENALKSQLAIAALYNLCGEEAAYERARERYVEMLKKALGEGGALERLRKEAFSYYRGGEWNLAREAFGELATDFRRKEDDSLRKDRFWHAESLWELTCATNSGAQEGQASPGRREAVRLFRLCIPGDKVEDQISAAAAARLGMMDFLEWRHDAAATWFQRAGEYRPVAALANAARAATFYVEWQDKKRYDKYRPSIAKWVQKCREALAKVDLHVLDVTLARQFEEVEREVGRIEETSKTAERKEEGK